MSPVISPFCLVLIVLKQPLCVCKRMKSFGQRIPAAILIDDSQVQLHPLRQVFYGRDIILTTTEWCVLPFAPEKTVE